MKATFTKQVSNARNYSGDKELTKSFVVVGCKDNSMRELIAVKVWEGRARSASVKYASIWTFAEPWTSGRGQAGGYGYCKTSAAVGDAIRSSGIELDSDINGRGESAIRDALKAIAEAMGYVNIIIVE